MVAHAATSSVSTSGSRPTTAAARLLTIDATFSPTGISAYFATSPRPARYSRGGSVDSVDTSANTPSGWWNAPTRFLPCGKVDRGLAADGGVDLGQQRGGRLHDRHAAVVDGRDETGSVADHAATERHDGVVAEQSPFSQAATEVVDGGEGLRLLAFTHEEHVGLDARRVQRSGECGRVEVGHAQLG